jgi:hypothetical protein
MHCAERIAASVAGKDGEGAGDPGVQHDGQGAVRSMYFCAPQGLAPLYGRKRTKSVPLEQHRLTDCLPLN